MKDLETEIRRSMGVDDARLKVLAEEVAVSVLDQVRGSSVIPPSRRRASMSSWRTALAAAVAVSCVLVTSILLVGSGALRPSPTSGGTQAQLSAGTWRPGDPANEMLISGRLRMADNGCIYLEGTQGTPVDVLWPADWSVREANEGVELVDAKGQVAARIGQIISTGGGELADVTRLTCHTPGAQEAVTVMAAVKVIG